MKGKVVIVTGATRGIGRAVLELFVERGAQVIGTYINSKAEAENMCIDLPIEMHRVDIRKPTDIRQFCERVKTSAWNIDCLVNNAGINIPKPYDKLKLGEWEEVMDVNLRGPFLMMKELAGSMVHGGSIVNISSVSGAVGGPFTPHYAASKGGLEALTRNFARLLAEKMVRVNCLAPGQLVDAMKPTKEAEEWHHNQSLIGLTSIKAVAYAVWFLATCESITGQTLHVDGGETLT